MDTLKLKKYSRPGSLVEGSINSRSKLVNSDRPLSGNTTLTSKGIVKSKREFLEFYVNDKPLSQMLDKFYEIKGSLLEDWIGILGWSVNKWVDIIKIKQLLGASITDKEIRAQYPENWDDREFEGYLDKHREELSDPEVIIYGCAECGDYDCGGISVKIDEKEDTFLWTFSSDNGHLIFEFDKYQYFNLFKQLIKKLEKE